jgi:6-phosphofructokinase 2
MRPILTVTLNPALDLDTSTPEVVPGPKLRCAQPRIDPGGGGVNVSRAIRILGGDSRCAVAVGGAIGALLVELLRAEGIDPVGIPVVGLTRQSLAVRSEATGEHYRFVLPGPMWDAAEAEAAFARIEALATPGTLLVASGSLPPGLAPDTWLRLDDRTAAHGAETILDTSGPALAATLVPRARPLFLLRVDRREAMELAGDSLQGISALAVFARTLVERGIARIVCLASGAEGSVMATADDLFLCCPPKVEVLSAIGAGDSFVAALTLALARGAPLREACRTGTAAAAAAVMTPATELCDRATTERLLQDCTVESLA